MESMFGLKLFDFDIILTVTTPNGWELFMQQVLMFESIWVQTIFWDKQFFDATYSHWQSQNPTPWMIWLTEKSTQMAIS
jgi:hypothetical protein